MKFSSQSAWVLVLAYVALVYVGLYLTPWMGDFLVEQEILGSLINWVYLVAGLLLFGLFYLKFKIRNPYAYMFLAIVTILFLAAFSRMPETTDRLHFLEHGLAYVLFYLALRFSNRGLVLVGRTFLLCFLFAAVDEGIQGLLPNRRAEWFDIWTNIFSYYLAAGMVAIAIHYGRGDDSKTR